MRILLILFVILAALTGGYFFQWQRQAEIFKTVAVKEIEKLNAGPEAADVDITINYEDISVGGFPFSHRVTLRNPEIKSHFSMAGIQALVTGSDAVSASGGDVSPMDSVTKINGEITLSVNYLNSSGEISMGGDFTGSDTLEGETMNWQMERADASTCSIDFRSSTTIDFFKTFVLGHPLDNEKLVKELDSIRCDVGEKNIVKADDKQPLASTGPMTIAITDIHLGDGIPAQGMHFIVDMPKLDAYDSYQQFYGSFGTGIAPSKFPLLPLKKFDVVGTQSLLMDVAVNMLRPVDKPEAEPEHVTIDMKSFRISNKLWELNYPLYLDMDRKDDNLSFVVRFNGEGKFHPEADLLIQESLVDQLSDPNIEGMLSMTYPNVDAEALKSAASEIVPRASGFGKFGMNIDVDGNLATNGNIPSGAGGITLRAFDFISEVYSLKMQGSYEASKNEGMLNIDCIQCEKLVGDAVEYNNRVQNALYTLDETRMPMIITTEMYEAIMAFLKKINLGKSENDISISVVSNGQGNVTISNRPLQEVMVEAMMLMQPASPPAEEEE